MAEVDPAKLRNLKIKTGVVKRYTKEKMSYEKEADIQKGKIEKFKAEGKEELFIRQQVNCLQESQMMVPEVQRKLGAAYNELKDLTTNEETFKGTGELKAALEVLKEAEPHLLQD